MRSVFHPARRNATLCAERWGTAAARGGYAGVVTRRQPPDAKRAVSACRWAEMDCGLFRSHGGGGGGVFGGLFFEV